jgi:pseudouridine-5'-phosphate glycosidase
MLRVLPNVEAALRAGSPVVALESSVFAQGLPIPQNRDAATRMLSAVERAGATPAITAVTRGTPTIGLEPEELVRFLRRDGVQKVSARDIAFAVASGRDGATTVAGSLALAKLAGIQVFATGGIGGVHRDAPFDESADLAELARTPMLVVCAGAKSILDLPATWERLESIGVPVIGYRTREFPGFFSAETGIVLEAVADDCDEIVSAFDAHRALGRTQAMLVVQPPPTKFAIAHDVIDLAVQEAQRECAKAGITGSKVTPFLLDAVSRLTGGTSVSANLALLEQNAALAGSLATICSAHAKGRSA